MLARQLVEAGREAGIFVDRIALFVGRDHLAARDIGHARTDFLQSRRQEIGDEVLPSAAGEELGERVQPGGVVERQAHGVFGGGPRCRGGLLPRIQQVSEAHVPTRVYSPQCTVYSQTKSVPPLRRRTLGTLAVDCGL